MAEVIDYGNTHITIDSEYKVFLRETNGYKIEYRLSFEITERNTEGENTEEEYTAYKKVYKVGVTIGKLTEAKVFDDFDSAFMEYQNLCDYCYDSMWDNVFDCIDCWRERTGAAREFFNL